MYLKGIGYDDVDHNHLNEDMIQWRAFVNTAVKLRFHKSRDFLGWLTDYQFIKWT
jgi:hypothetical protein